jgi:hypothetical protein
MPLSQNSTRAALIVAHPSHELRVHGWLEQTRPYVCVLTDGGGRFGEPRLQRTSEVLDRVGARQGSLYGRLKDLEVYSAILNGDADLFGGLVEELAEAFAREQIEYVVGDAAEGYSVTHDICRIMIGAAVELAESRYGQRIANFDFLVVGSPDECANELRQQAIWLHLDDNAFGRKLKAALGYTPELAADVEAALSGTPFRGVRRFSEPQLAGEVDVDMSAAIVQEIDALPELKARLVALLEDVPLNAFRVECLRPVGNSSGADWNVDDAIFYELYGEKLVAAGHYERVIRYREHMLTLAERIREKAGRKERWMLSAS